MTIVSAANTDNGKIIIYQSPQGRTKIDVQLQNETLWLNQSQIADLFQTDRSIITKHIGNIFESVELDESATCVKFAQVQKEGRRSVSREVSYFNLDVIISVGYRVQSSMPHDSGFGQQGSTNKIMASSISL